VSVIGVGVGVGVGVGATAFAGAAVFAGSGSDEQAASRRAVAAAILFIAAHPSRAVASRKSGYARADEPNSKEQARCRQSA
jgi:hypothetical protein